MATKESTMSVTGTVTWVNPYTGGARPPPDVEAEGRRTKQCTNTTLHVRRLTKDNLSDFDLDSTVIDLNIDSNGTFKIHVDLPGKYYIFNTTKFGMPSWYNEENVSMMMDKDENARWRRTPECTFEVLEGVTALTDVELHWVNGVERGLPLPC